MVSEKYALDKTWVNSINPASGETGQDPQLRKTTTVNDQQYNTECHTHQGHLDIKHSPDCTHNLDLGGFRTNNHDSRDPLLVYGRSSSSYHRELTDTNRYTLSQLRTEREIAQRQIDCLNSYITTMCSNAITTKDVERFLDVFESHKVAGAKRVQELDVGIRYAKDMYTRAQAYNDGAQIQPQRSKMFIDLNVPFLPTGFNSQAQNSGKSKQKQKASSNTAVSAPPPTLSAIDLEALSSRLDTLVHLGYTVVALNYTVERKIDPATHVNPLLSVPSRKDIIVLRRLTIILDESSERGFGLSTQHATHLASYDIIALQPTTASSFSLACLTHTQPSPTTAHIITIDATLASPQLPFRLKPSLVRTAIRNGATFEISYAGALASDESSRRNWWAGAREVVRATKGKGILLSGGGHTVADLRAPLDAVNLATVLGLDQDTARNAMGSDAKSLVTRASTRQTYRAVLSAPTIVNSVGSMETVSQDTAPLCTQVASASSTKRIREAEDLGARTAETETPMNLRPSKRSKPPGAGKNS